MMNACVNCKKWDCSRDKFNNWRHLCYRKAKPYIDIVTDKIRYSEVVDCEDERNENGDCGIQGKYFEELKLTVIQEIKAVLLFNDYHYRSANKRKHRKGLEKDGTL